MIIEKLFFFLVEGAKMTIEKLFFFLVADFILKKCNNFLPIIKHGYIRILKFKNLFKQGKTMTVKELEERKEIEDIIERLSIVIYICLYIIGIIILYICVIQLLPIQGFLGLQGWFVLVVAAIIEFFILFSVIGLCMGFYAVIYWLRYGSWSYTKLLDNIEKHFEKQIKFISNILINKISGG